MALPYTPKVDHMTIRSLSQEAQVYRAPLKEGRDLVVHERYFSLELNFGRLSGPYVLLL